MGSETPRSYVLRTYGCQMNEHDSERIAGLLEADGLVRAASEDDADEGEDELNRDGDGGGDARRGENRFDSRRRHTETLGILASKSNPPGLLSLQLDL